MGLALRLSVRDSEAAVRFYTAVGEAHGWRLGRLVDPFGLHWEIGRPLQAS